MASGLARSNARPRKKANGEGSIRQRPDGVWEARIVLAGRRRSYYGKTKRAVVEKIAAERTDADRGRFVEPARDTLGGFLAYWLKAVAPHSVRPGTLRNYRGHVRSYIVPKIGGLLRQRVTVARGRIRRWRTATRAAAAPRQLPIHEKTTPRPKPGRV